MKPIDMLLILIIPVFALSAQRCNVVQTTNIQKVELSQRWPRDAPHIWCLENFRESLSTPTTIFPEIFNGLLFRSIL